MPKPIRNFLAKKILKASGQYQYIFFPKSKLIGYERWELTADEYYKVHGMKSITGLKAYFIAPFQHFIDMFKDVKDTFKPYKAGYQIRNDILQPLKGIGNISSFTNLSILLVQGLIYTLFVVPYKLIKHAGKETFADEMNRIGKNYVKGLAWMLEGTIGLIRGVTRIAATPLLILKMALRGIITVIKGMPKLEENASMQELAAMGLENLEREATTNPSTDLIIKTLHVKYQKRYEEQETAIAQQEEKSYQSRFSKTGQKSYLELFSKKDNSTSLTPSDSPEPGIQFSK